MGGVVPLGNDPHPDPTRRELVVNINEAPRGETLFRHYNELGCLGRVAAEAARRDLRSKLHHYKSGRMSGGARGGTDPSGLRLPANALEDLVTTRVVVHLLEHAARHAILTDPDAALAHELAVRVTEFAAAIRAAPERHLNTLIAAGQITQERISVSLDAGQLATALSVSAVSLAPEFCAINAPLEMRRRGTGTKLVSGTMKPAPDKTIIRTLALAHLFAGLQRTGMSFAEIARREGKGESFVRSRAVLSFLAPKIQARIMEGTLPPDITLERLVRTNLPDDWADQ